MRNFYILHKTGRILFSRNFQGDPLERNIVTGFASSLPNLCRALLREEIQQVVCQRSRIVLRLAGDYIFLAHVNNAVPFTVASNILIELIRCAQMLFGHPGTWSSDSVDFDGCQDIIEMLCTAGMQDPCVAVGGLLKAPIKAETRLRLDKLLVYLESIQGICNNGSMLLIEDSVIFSRFELDQSRQILYLHRARPLRHQALSYTPVFMTASWFGLIRMRLASYTLAILCHLDSVDPSPNGLRADDTSTATSPGDPLLGDVSSSTTTHAPAVTTAGACTTPLATLLHKLTEFQSVFLYARLELPSEEKPALLRQFAKRETLLFLHAHTKSGTVTFPRPRPLPEIQTRELYATFWALFGEAKSALAVAGTREVTYLREYYWYYARADPDQELHVLFAADAVSLEQMHGHVQEILVNVNRQYS
ncbi:hypothetical protein GGF32_005383 [Allomyces javanicus]|nr:hypothetical protein GGF32_005383 [Allomyces javanicus]